MALHERVTPLAQQPLEYLRDLYKVYLPEDRRSAVNKMNKKQILEGFLAQGVDTGGRINTIDLRGELAEDDGLNFH